jgi:hypothetical protein
MYLDGGLLYYRLDPATGKVLGYRVFDDSHPEKEGSLMQEIRHLTMPVGLPDVLSSDGKHIYMRSQMMSMEGERQGVAVQGTQRGLAGLGRNQKKKVSSQFGRIRSLFGNDLLFTTKARIP